MTDQECIQVLDQYRRGLEGLEKFKATHFGRGTQIIVDHPRYKGHGTVVPDVLCPVDKLAVRISNGNVWWYPIESCLPNGKDQP